MVVFQLALLEEAKEFLQSLPRQAHEKILYNIWRVAGRERNSELFKKLEAPKYGNFALSTMGQRTACSPSGTQAHKLW